MQISKLHLRINHNIVFRYTIGNKYINMWLGKIILISSACTAWVKIQQLYKK